MKALPSGISSFKELIRGQYYFVDKTPFIRSVLSDGAFVQLFPCPERFGKSLNLNMIREFISLDGDPTLFEGLKISEDKQFCKMYQKKYPVLYLDLKDVKGNTFAEACQSFSDFIYRLYSEDCAFLRDSPKLWDALKNNYETYADKSTWVKDSSTPAGSLSKVELSFALEELTFLLQEHYGQRVVVLLDSCDVPMTAALLHDAEDPGYYENMEDLLMSSFSSLLKGNHSLQFAVISGCLWIARDDSLNNISVQYTSLDIYEDYFGFTEAEVKAMLAYYGIPEMMEDVRVWCGGYRMGEELMYCSGDVIEYVKGCLSGGAGKTPSLRPPHSYGSDILSQLLRKSYFLRQQECIELLNGKVIRSTPEFILTYRDMNERSNFINFLGAAGCLTVYDYEGAWSDTAKFELPNLAMKHLLADHVLRWLCEVFPENKDTLESLREALPKGDANSVGRLLSNFLTGAVPPQMPKPRSTWDWPMYPGIVLAPLCLQWDVLPGGEVEDSLCDISFLAGNGAGIILELLDAENKGLQETAATALQQAKAKPYLQQLKERGCSTVLVYGIGYNLRQASAAVEVFS